MPTPADTLIVVLLVLLPVLYFYKDSLPLIGKPSKNSGDRAGVNGNGSKGGVEEEGDPRDWLEQMNKANKRCIMFYGSQTGTAEEYAIRLAKEAKSKFGISSLVCDPEEYDFTKLDAAAEEDKVVFFLMATYGEGDPTDNAQPLVEFLMDDEVQFSMEREGGERLKGLKYVVFGLGNRTYEHFNEVARKLDKRLTELEEIGRAHV